MSVRCDITDADFFMEAENKTLQFTITSDGVTAINIAGYTFRWVFKDARETPDADALVDDTTGFSIIDAPTGRVDLVLPTATTAPLGGRKRWHRLDRTNAGAEATLLHGVASIQEV